MERAESSAHLMRELEAQMYQVCPTRSPRPPRTAVKKLRIVISGGILLTGPLGDARRFPSTRWFTIPGATPGVMGSCRGVVRRRI